MIKGSAQACGTYPIPVRSVWLFGERKLIYWCCFCLSFVSMAGCASSLPAPQIQHLQWSQSSAVLQTGCSSPGMSSLPQVVVFGHLPPKKKMRALVVLVHGLGTNARIWHLPGYASLVSLLYNDGFGVFLLDYSTSSVWGCPGVDRSENRGLSFDSLANELVAVLSILRRQEPDLSFYGVGFDVGGTALYQAVGKTPGLVEGVVGLAAPLSFGGWNRAMDGLVEQLSSHPNQPLDWQRLKDKTPSGMPAVVFEQSLLSSQLASDRWQAFYRLAQAPLSGTLVETLPERAGPVLFSRSLVGRLAEQKALALLVVTSPADGLAPPWQTDPAVFGLRRNNIERHYLTRANGQPIEFGHLDLVLHQAAQKEVYPLIHGWLKKQWQTGMLANK